MNKKLQSILGLSALVIAGSIAYYLFSYLPEKNEQALQLTLQNRCLELGNQKQKEDSKYNKENSLDGSSYITDFNFTKKSSDCYYRTTYMGRTGIMEKNIIDLFTNKTIAHYIQNEDSRVIAGDKAAYERVEDYHF